MLTYTTHLKKLVLPEYGRNIQRMVDHCLTIEDRYERTRCAATIVKTMESLFPIQGNADAYRRKLWDHLAIMSDFALDVDVPFELVSRNSLDNQPEPLNYDQGPLEHRHYGLLLQRSILAAAEMPEGEERDALVLLLANHMKKLMLSVNPDGVDDEKVFKDLRHLSNGKIVLSPEKVTLHEFKAAPAPTGKKKKKK
ncbi:MAG: DUF4290 domain-containing protein [Muribaculaceae bacterium]|nr:DUF4290 domain-containing protein [Muribaculaceae bacterium]MDE6702732.1 DUF4290 domain-containing protein [Muribaculaceae bacterium]